MQLTSKIGTANTLQTSQKVLLANRERFGYSLLGAFVSDIETGSITIILGLKDFVAYHTWCRTSEFDEERLTYKDIPDFTAPK